MRIGPYEVLEELGRGGMGAVYRAHDARFGRDVAIKVVTHAAQYPEDLVRFKTEAVAAARLRHPHVVSIHAADADAGRPYLVLDYVPGESLAQRIKRLGPLSPEEVSRIGVGLAHALEAAHDVGIIHRDVKPQNVLLHAEGDHPLLTDFGLAKLLNRETQVTATGSVLGTPAYMAPEQALADVDRIGAATDVYGLGATLFTALAGTPPFKGSSPADTLQRLLHQPTPDLRALRPELPGELVAVIERCLAKARQDRYPTAAALAEALEAAGREEHPGDTPGRASRAWVVMAVVALLAIAAVLRLSRRAERVTTRPAANSRSSSPEEQGQPAPTPTPAEEPATEESAASQVAGRLTRSDDGDWWLEGEGPLLLKVPPQLQPALELLVGRRVRLDLRLEAQELLSRWAVEGLLEPQTLLVRVGDDAYLQDRDGGGWVGPQVPLSPGQELAIALDRLAYYGNRQWRAAEAPRAEQEQLFGYAQLDEAGGWIPFFKLEVVEPR